MSDQGILRGADLGPVPECSLAQHILPKIKALSKDQVFQVDAETGQTQTVYENLTNSIRLSEGLRKRGLGENEVVAMVCRNSFAADEIVLATWLSGATIAPISGQLKIAEMKHLFDLCEPKFVFTEEPFIGIVTSTLESLSSSATIILAGGGKNSRSSHPCLEDFLVDVDVDGYQPLPVKSPSTQLVGILSSSGTTGLQKAVGITHTNLIFQELSMAKMDIFRHALPFLQISAFFWVTGVLTYLRCLVTGTKRILIGDPTNENILKAIDERKAVWTLLGPQLLASITDSPEFDKYDVSSMETFLVGGAPFVRSICEKITAKWGPGKKIFNNYGTTEATGCLLSNIGEDVCSLGKPTPGVQMKLIDLETGKNVEANAVGELCAKSPGIMWGYLKNEEATREAIDSDGWLHTGDLGYRDDLGQVYLVDRIKAMIKVMNMQVSPVEVEVAIESLPGVLEVGVAGVTHDGIDYKIKALVVKKKGSPLTEEDICAHVADTLSDYKRLTGGVNFVESLPKTASGKLKRKEINQMAQALFTG